MRIIVWRHCTDVVRAYKGLLKEKEALEASLKALSVQQLEEEVEEEKESEDTLRVEEPDQEEAVGESGKDQLQLDGHTISDAVTVNNYMDHINIVVHVYINHCRCSGISLEHEFCVSKLYEPIILLFE